MTRSLHDGEVKIYDSCFHGHKLSASIEEQLVQCCIYKTSVQGRILPVTIIPVQQQTGSVDCGVFSIVFAYQAALGKNMSRATFAQEEIRHHLVQCFEARKLLPFPEESKKVHRCRKKHLFIPLYCTCGLPESYDSDISCDGCGQWFHFRCMHIKHHLLRHGFVHIAYSIIFPVYIHFCCCISNYLLESFTFRCQ